MKSLYSVKNYLCHGLNFLTIFSSVCLIFSSSSVFAAAEGLEIEFYFQKHAKQGCQHSADTEDALFLRLKTPDGQIQSTPLFSEKNKIMNSELHNDGVSINCSKHQECNETQHLQIQTQNSSISLTYDTDGLIVVNALNAQIPVMLLAPNTLSLQAGSHRASSLFIAAPEIYNYSDLTITGYLGLYGSSQYPMNIINIPTAKIRCAGLMDIFEGNFINRGKLIASDDLVVNLHGNSFYHRNSDEKVSKILIKKSLKIENAHSVILNADVKKAKSSSRRAFRVYAESATVSKKISIRSVKFVVGNLHLKKSSNLKTKTLNLTTNDGLIEGIINNKGHVSVAGLITLTGSANAKIKKVLRVKNGGSVRNYGILEANEISFDSAAR